MIEIGANAPISNKLATYILRNAKEKYVLIYLLYS